ncbi:MAG: helix-hairpin-helix domain-containing protein, partial [Ruthenibacterium sp.]
MEETLSISGTVETVVYSNEQTGYAVLEVADERDGELHTAVGPLCEVRAGEEVTLHGRFAMHPTFGPQFKTESYEVRLPETAAAIRRYLSGGALPHIGKAIAARIVAAFGEESLEVIASQPEVLATVKGLTREKAYEASREFQKMFGVREAIECLARWQLPASVAVALYRHYGPDTVDMLRRDPYLLCGYPAHQDFRAADAIAGQMGLEYDSFERVRAGLVQVLRHNLNNGHACLPAARL